MNKFFAIALAFIVALPGVTQAQTSGSDNAVLENASALLTRQQQRMDILEAGLKEVRGILENDLREIKMKVEQMQSSSSEAGSSQTADLNALRDQMEKLSDMLAMTNRRMERTWRLLQILNFVYFALKSACKHCLHLVVMMRRRLWCSKIRSVLARRRRFRYHAMLIPVYQVGLLKRAL